MRIRKVAIVVICISALGGAVVHRWLAGEVELTRGRSCAGNIRALGALVHQYHSHRGRLPTAPGQDWVIEAAPYFHWLPGLLYCPNNRPDDTEWRLINKTWNMEGKQRVEHLALLRNHGIKLTSYEMPKNVAGRSYRELKQDTVILVETGPGHHGKHHFLLANGDVVER